MTAHTPETSWYSVRSIYRTDRIQDGVPLRTFEERVVLFRAKSVEEALAKGKAEAIEYATPWPHPRILDRIMAFHIHADELQEGDEVWSCIRGLDMSDEEFIRQIYDGEYESLTNTELRDTNG